MLHASTPPLEIFQSGSIQWSLIFVKKRRHILSNTEHSPRLFFHFGDPPCKTLSASHTSREGIARPEKRGLRLREGKELRSSSRPREKQRSGRCGHKTKLFLFKRASGEKRSISALGYFTVPASSLACAPSFFNFKTVRDHAGGR